MDYIRTRLYDMNARKQTPSKSRERAPPPYGPRQKTKLQVVDLKAEVSRLKDQLERAAAARVEAVAVLEAQRDAAAEREEELREDLWQARQAAERVTISEEDAVIAVERDMRAEFEKDMAVLKERATEAEERVRKTVLFFFLAGCLPPLCSTRGAYIQGS